MAAKQIAYDNDAREKILRGIQKLSRAVRVTLGPSGRVVVLEKSFGTPTVTKDGVTVAKEIELDDAYENMGAQMVKEVASKSSKDAGDGTTTATIYAEAIFAEGLKYMTAGGNANQIKRGIDKAVEAIVDELARMSKDVSASTEIAQAGTCAATQDEQIGQIIAEATDKDRQAGGAPVQAGQSPHPARERVDAMQVGRRQRRPRVAAVDRRWMTPTVSMSCGSAAGRRSRGGPRSRAWPRPCPIRRPALPRVPHPQAPARARRR